MAIDGVPFDSLQNARLFKRRMSKPWIVKVIKKREINSNDSWEYRLPDERIVACDDLFDLLHGRAVLTHKDFDARPYIQNVVFTMLKRGVPRKEDPSEAVDLVRKVVGDKLQLLPEVTDLAPLPKLPEWIRSSLGPKYNFEYASTFKIVTTRGVESQVLARVDDAKHPWIPGRFDTEGNYLWSVTGRQVTTDELNKILKNKSSSAPAEFIRASYRPHTAKKWNDFIFRFKASAGTVVKPQKVGVKKKAKTVRKTNKTP